MKKGNPAAAVVLLAFLSLWTSLNWDGAAAQSGGEPQQTTEGQIGSPRPALPIELPAKDLIVRSKGAQTPGVPSVSDSQPSISASKASELRALKERIRKSIRKEEGREIDIETIEVASANAGDTVIGKVVEETNDEIVIDREPCKDKMVQFRKPYVKESTRRTVTCNKKAYNLFAVEKK